MSGNLIENIILCILGVSGGISVAAGIFALITTLKVVPRMLDRLHLSRYVYLVETLIALGGTTGAVITVFQRQLPLGYAVTVVFALLAGIFVGCLSMALAETLRVIPVFYERCKLQRGLPLLVFVMGVGKALGSFMQLVIWR